MQSVVIVAWAGTQLDRFAECVSGSGWRVELRSDQELLISSGEKRVFIFRDERVMEEYDAREIHTLLERISNPVFFVFEFNDFEFGREVLRRVADSQHLIIDDDHGGMAVGTDFVKRLESQPTWDWRR